MKKISLLIAGVLIGSLAFAGRRDESPKTTSGMAVVKTNATSYKLIYKSEKTTDVKVEIFDSQNALVFSETIEKSDGFVRPYNFERLSDGAYTIKIDNGSNRLTETIDYRIGKGTKLAHLVRLSDGKYLLTVVGKGEDRLSIRLYNDEGKRIRNDLEPVYGNFAQVYDLSRVPGNVSFEIRDKSGATKVLEIK